MIELDEEEATKAIAEAHENEKHIDASLPSHGSAKQKGKEKISASEKIDKMDVDVAGGAAITTPDTATSRRRYFPLLM